MATIKRIGFGQVEPNHLSAQRTAQIYAQLPAHTKTAEKTADTIEILEKYSKENDLILITARNNKVGLQNQIDKFGLRKYFKEIYVVNSGKNTSELKAEILKRKNAVLMFGDTLSDKKAADIAGIEFEHFNNGFHLI